MHDNGQLTFDEELIGIAIPWVKLITLTKYQIT